MMGSLFTVNTKRFAIAGGAGFAALIALLAMLLLSGTAFAAFPLSGVGGFTISADKITGTGFKLYPAIGETEQRGAWGQGAIDLATADITNLVLTKNINTESALGAYGIKSIDVVVTGGNVSGQNLKLRVTGIQAASTSFTGLEVQEHKTDNPLNVIDLSAPSLTLEKPSLNTHYLSAGSITIPNMKLKVVANMKDGSRVGDF